MKESKVAQRRLSSLLYCSLPPLDAAIVSDTNLRILQVPAHLVIHRQPRFWQIPPTEKEFLKDFKQMLFRVTGSRMAVKNRFTRTLVLQT